MCAALLAALLFVCTVCGAGNALPGAVKDALPFGEMLAPLTAQAGSGYAMQEGTAGIAKGDKIYFGTFPSTGYVHVNPKNASDPYWRVLDNAGDNAGGTNAMFLLSENCWGTGGTYGNVYFDQDGNASTGQSAPNQWQGSDAQAWCTSFYAAVFSTKEQAAIKGINKSDSVFQHNGVDYFAASINILNGDKVFFLSGEEACNSAYGFATDRNETGDNSGRVAYYGDASTTRGYWWLRSPGLTGLDAALVTGVGRVTVGGLRVNHTYGVRPAFNLNLQSVLFSSAAVGGKSPDTEGAGTLNQVSTTSPSEWKLTLLDDGTVSGLDGHTGFSAQCVIGALGTQSATAATVEQGKQVTLSYSGAKTTTNEYVSAILKDSTGNILYYGNLANTAGGSKDSPATGVPLTIPSTVQPGTYTLGVFAEQFNGDKKTDYASKVTNISLTVTAPATALSITTGVLPSGREGDSYTTILSASGTAPITWSATGLAAGLSINSTTGEISGTPTESGTFTVNVTATNSAGSNTKTLSLKIDPASAPAPTPTPTPVPTHNHHYEWVTLREADEHNDGEMVYRCKDCGDVLYRVPLTAYYVFNRNTAEKIRKAEQGATLMIETRRWISFHKMVMQAMADRPDVTLQVSFLDGEYRGNRMTFMIPAGTDALSLPNEEGYCGFLYLGGIFGLHPAEEN